MKCSANCFNFDCRALNPKTKCFRVSSVIFLHLENIKRCNTQSLKKISGSESFLFEKDFEIKTMFWTTGRIWRWIFLAFSGLNLSVKQALIWHSLWLCNNYIIFYDNKRNIYLDKLKESCCKLTKCRLTFEEMVLSPLSVILWQLKIILLRKELSIKKLLGKIHYQLIHLFVLIAHKISNLFDSMVGEMGTTN